MKKAFISFLAVGLEAIALNAAEPAAEEQQVPESFPLGHYSLTITGSNFSTNLDIEITSFSEFFIPKCLRRAAIANITASSNGACTFGIGGFAFCTKGLVLFADEDVLSFTLPVPLSASTSPSVSLVQVHKKKNSLKAVGTILTYPLVALPIPPCASFNECPACATLELIPTP